MYPGDMTVVRGWSLHWNLVRGWERHSELDPPELK